MNILRNNFPHSKGFTLIELTVVMAVIFVLVAFTTVGVNSYRDWKTGLEAGETIKGVYQAQRIYLSDNPTSSVGDLEDDDIIPYLPGGEDAIPTITGLDGETCTIDVSVSPPQLLIGDTVYDPSPPNDNGVWDAGK